MIPKRAVVLGAHHEKKTRRTRRDHLSVSRLKQLARSPLILLAVPVAIAVSVLLTECSSSGNGRAGPYDGVTSTRPTTPATGGAALTLRHTSVGTILADGQGFTLYAFEGDKGANSSCSGACAAIWPPVVTTADVAVTGGANKALVGQTTRAGGVRQLTYAGHPLYRFEGDSSPGSTAGQGSLEFGARWDVLTVTGQELTTDG